MVRILCWRGCVNGRRRSSHGWKKIACCSTCVPSSQRRMGRSSRHWRASQNGEAAGPFCGPDSAFGYHLHHRSFHAQLDELVVSLKAHELRTLVDIRAFPNVAPPAALQSRVARSRASDGTASTYVWMKELGGRRKKIRDDSPNTGSATMPSVRSPITC